MDADELERWFAGIVGQLAPVTMDAGAHERQRARLETECERMKVDRDRLGEAKDARLYGGNAGLSPAPGRPLSRRAMLMFELKALDRQISRLEQYEDACWDARDWTGYEAAQDAARRLDLCRRDVRRELKAKR